MTANGRKVLLEGNMFVKAHPVLKWFTVSRPRSKWSACTRISLTNNFWLDNVGVIVKA
eukprot:CAMPEP_0184647356 /NCGR_PEP_ID=MMETSP0308-20130426/4256_1 /TAXON_ID=38269 /ORGANISM="Gloeochaete witrockiana, Strain SAG 46.84" /LENGTH=57 /DNA_ID=CAMNT_0027078225 /DNA_START=38 /DNA_END=211 /DNA_ORIENTATION=-